MAPSLETSFRGNLPVPPITPVRVMTDMLYRVRERAKKARVEGDTDDEPHSPDSPTPQPDNPSPPRRRVPDPSPDPFATPVKNAIISLRTTSAALLTTSSPVQSSSTPPRLPPTVTSPEKVRNTGLLSVPPTTALERELQAALREQQTKNKAHKSQMVAMQSALVLNGAYCDLVRSQLAAQEEKSKKKCRKNPGWVVSSLNRSQAVPRSQFVCGLEHLGEVHITRFQASRWVTIGWNPFEASWGILDLETCFKWLKLTRATPI
ncbi:hypothetical protein B0H13DRAFT_1876468 [Mycena leptocephala]|nr:hypothetical protein B0H13DRAFT_1876468 [Mycena leptocephala]